MNFYYHIIARRHSKICHVYIFGHLAAMVNYYVLQCVILDVKMLKWVFCQKLAFPALK